jgi:hypothetical protein
MDFATVSIINRVSWKENVSKFWSNFKDNGSHT